MKVFFLDDDNIRLNAAKVKFANHELHLAKNANEAIRILDKESPFDLVHLDHDLGGVYLPSDEKSGYAVAMHIVHMPAKKKPKTVIVHSYNPNGSRLMIQALRSFVKVYYYPFDAEDFKTSI